MLAIAKVGFGIENQIQNSKGKIQKLKSKIKSY
jgi:hypothetical protein